MKILKNAAFGHFTELRISKPDDIGTPLKLFELFFDDILVYMIVGYSKLHGHRKKECTSCEITNETFRLF